MFRQELLGAPEGTNVRDIKTGTRYSVIWNIGKSIITQQLDTPVGDGYIWPRNELESGQYDHLFQHWQIEHRNSYVYMDTESRPHLGLVYPAREIPVGYIVKTQGTVCYIADNITDERHAFVWGKDWLNLWVCIAPTALVKVMTTPAHVLANTCGRMQHAKEHTTYTYTTRPNPSGGFGAFRVTACKDGLSEFK